MENTTLEKRRKADFKTGLLLLAGSIWILFESFSFPMKDSYGGVQNVWYVSPALFPLGVSIGLIFLSLLLLRRAYVDGGTHRLFTFTYKGSLSDRTWRFISILLIFGFSTYLYLPHVDFFITVMLTLIVMTTVFYFDHQKLQIQYTLAFVGSSCLMVLLFASGIANSLIELNIYSIDILSVFIYLGYVIYCYWHIPKDQKDLVRKFKVSVVVSMVIPLFLCPAFKFGLLVPLPKEGIVIELMSIIRFSAF